MVKRPICVDAFARCASIGVDFDLVRWLRLPDCCCAAAAVGAVVPTADGSPAAAVAVVVRFVVVGKQSTHLNPKWHERHVNLLRLVFVDRRVVVTVYRPANMADRYPFSLAEVTMWHPCLCTISVATDAESLRLASLYFSAGNIHLLESLIPDLSAMK